MIKERITQITLAPEGEPIFSEFTTTIKLDDEAAGEFLILVQDNEDLEKGEVKFYLEEWEVVDKAVRKLIEYSRDWNTTTGITDTPTIT